MLRTRRNSAEKSSVVRLEIRTLVEWRRHQPVQRAIEISQLFGSPRAPKNGADYSVLIRSAALSGGHTNRFKGRTGIKATTELAETSGKNRVLQFGALGRKSAGRAELFDSMRSVVDWMATTPAGTTRDRDQEITEESKRNGVSPARRWSRVAC